MDSIPLTCVDERGVTSQTLSSSGEAISNGLPKPNFPAAKEVAPAAPARPIAPKMEHVKPIPMEPKLQNMLTVSGKSPAVLDPRDMTMLMDSEDEDESELTGSGEEEGESFDSEEEEEEEATQPPAKRHANSELERLRAELRAKEAELATMRTAQAKVASALSGEAVPTVYKYTLTENLFVPLNNSPHCLVAQKIISMAKEHGARAHERLQEILKDGKLMDKADKIHLFYEHPETSEGESAPTFNQIERRAIEGLVDEWVQYSMLRVYATASRDMELGLTTEEFENVARHLHKVAIGTEVASGIPYGGLQQIIRLIKLKRTGMKVDLARETNIRETKELDTVGMTSKVTVEVQDVAEYDVDFMSVARNDHFSVAGSDKRKLVSSDWNMTQKRASEAIQGVTILRSELRSRSTTAPKKRKRSQKPKKPIDGEAAVAVEEK